MGEREEREALIAMATSVAEEAETVSAAVVRGIIRALVAEIQATPTTHNAGVRKGLEMARSLASIRADIDNLASSVVLDIDAKLAALEEEEK